MANFSGFPVRTLAFVQVPPAVPFVPSFDPVTDVSAASLRPRNQAYTYPASAAPTFVPPLPAVTTWGQQEPISVQDFKRQQFTYPESVAPLVPIVSVLVIGWRIPRDIQVAQRPLVYAYPSFFLNPAPVVAGEIITVDKWFKLNELPFQGAKSRPDLSSTLAFTQLVAAAEIITVDKWYTAPGGPRQDSARTQHLFSAGGFTELVTAAETITVDKWYNQTSRALPGAGTQQYSYPAAAFFVRLTAVETITVDKWYNRTSTPVMDRARTQYTFPASVMDTKPPAAVVTGILEEQRIELGSFFGITVPDIDLGIA